MPGLQVPVGATVLSKTGCSGCVRPSADQCDCSLAKAPSHLISGKTRMMEFRPQAVT